MSTGPTYPRERSRNPFIQKTRVLGLKFDGGRVLSALQLPLFTLAPPRGFGVLSTTGRRTGKIRRKCVRAIRDGDRAYVVSIGGTYAIWFKNIQADPHVSLRLRGGTFAGLARALHEGNELEAARRVYCEALNVADYAECALWRRGRPSAAKIKELHEGWFEHGTALVVELGPPRSQPLT